MVIKMRLTSDATYLGGDAEFEVTWQCPCGLCTIERITIGHATQCQGCQKAYILSDSDSPYEVKLVEK